MKKLLLAFAPGAFPTYVPLGIGSLSAYLKKNLPSLNLTVKDINVEMWNRFIVRNPQTDLTDSFFRGNGPPFYSPETYRIYQKQLLDLYGGWKQTEASLERFMRTGERDDDLHRFQHHLFEILNLNGTEICAFSAAFPSQVLPMAAAARLVRAAYARVTIVVGGSALSSLDVEALLQAVPEIDFAAMGEGEAGLDHYLRTGNAEQSCGWMRRDTAGFKQNRLPRAISTTDIPPPDFSDLPLDQYFNPEPVIPVLFSRGCRWRRCRFCAHNTGFGRYRTMQYPLFVDHLEHLGRTHAARHFYFADQYIAGDDLEGIANEILKRGLDIRFHAMGRPSTDFAKGTFELLFEAGCRFISWGVESGSDRLLETCDKGTNRTTITQILEDAHAAGINNLAMMIFGLPGSTDEDLQETLDFASDVSDVVDAFTSSAFQLFERTPFFSQRERHGLYPLRREILFESNGSPVHSHRWSFEYRNGNGRSVPRAETEIARWRQWQLFVRGGETFFETLPAEHYLLLSSRLADDVRGRPDEPRPKPRTPLPKAG